MQYLPIRYCSDEESAILGSVHCFQEDDRGYMWIGSERGLFRYDGFRLIPYHELSAKPGTKVMASVSALTRGTDGRIYAGFNTGEILGLDPKTFAAELYRMPPAKALENVLDLYTIRYGQGMVWAGTESGLLCFDPGTGNFSLFKPTRQGVFGAATDVIYAVLPDPRQPGRLWVGTRTELLSFDLDTHQFTSYRITFADLRSRSGQLFGCLEQAGDRLWCGGYASGIKTLDTSTGAWHDQLVDAFEQDIMDLVWIDGEIYLVHYDFGLGRLDTVRKQVTYFRDPGRKVAGYEREKYRAVYADRSGYLWLGSESGFARLRPGKQDLQHVFLPPRPDESEFFYTSSVEDMGDHYLAATSFGYGFYKWYKSDGHVERLPNPIYESMDQGRDIFCTQKRADGGVDIFSRKGIWRYEPTTGKVLPLNLNIMAVHAVPWRDGYIVLTGRSTLEYLRDYRRVRTIDFDYADTGVERITHFTVEGDELWAVGNSSIIRIDLETGARKYWQNSPEKEYFAYGFLFTIEYHDGQVVVGNNSAGFEVFTLKNGELELQQRYLRDIRGRRIRVAYTERHGDKVYMASNQGLIIYDLALRELQQIDRADGLLVQNLGKTWVGNLEVFDDGRIIISGHGFFTIVEPSAFDTPVPKLELAQLSQNGFPLNGSAQAGRLELPHDQNFFEVALRVQPLRVQHRLQYRHRLKGYDDHWVATQDGKIRYASIPPGKYTLEVEASSSYHWQEVALLTLPVIIVPPFYQTPWFYALCLSAVLVLGAFLYRKRVGYIRRQEELKSEYNRKVAQLEMEALRAQMNPHFIFNALNSIEYYINEENTEDAVNYLQKFAALIRTTLQNSKQPYISLREELASLRYYIEIEQMRLDQSFDFQLEIAEDLRPDRILLPPLLLQPYVENAIWHGLLYQQEKRGKLWIRCTRQAGYTEIRIIDNGIGRERSAAIRQQRLKNKKSMGMVLTKRRMELNESVTGIRTQVKVEDLVDSRGESAGTSVIISLTQESQTHATNREI